MSVRLGAPSFRAAGARWWVRAGEDRERMARLVERALAAVDAGAAAEQKRGRRKAMHALSLEGRALLLKTNRYRGLGAIARAWRASKARHELAVAAALAAAGLPAPVPLAAGERRRAGRLVEDWLLIERLPDTVELGVRWRAAGAAERRRLAAGMGALARTLHDAGLVQEDYAPNNFLVRPGATAELLAIDFERAHLGGGPVPERARLAMLAKLDRRIGAAASRADRLRFLRAYGGGPAEARHWWARVAEAAPRLAARDVRRWRRTATADGRRLRRLAAGRWRGFARREVDLAALLPEVETAADELPRGGVASGAQTWIVVVRGSRVREAEDAWAAAHALWDGRALGPRPLALFVAEDRAAICLERAAGARRGGELTGPESDRAARVLQARLEALGTLRAPLTPVALAFEASPRGGARALLVDPWLWRPGGR
jgi:tRNA A-37 threonylcarbamoyl transferase component Bud32